MRERSERFWRTYMEFFSCGCGKREPCCDHGFFAGAPVFSEKSFVSPLILIFAKVQYKSHKNVFCQIKLKEEDF